MITRIALNNPLAVYPVSLIWGALKAGALHMERVTSLNRLVVNLIQMFFVLFVAVDYESIAKAIRENIILLFKREFVSENKNETVGEHR